MLRYARKHFPDPLVAEEVVQEAFVAAVKAVSGFKGDSSPRTWLTSILRHKIIDRIRARTRDNSVSLDDCGERDLSRYFDEHDHWRPETGPVQWASDPDSVLEQKQFLSVLDGCLGKLPTRFRDIFLLRELEGLSREEISESLTLTSTNVGVILHRARLALRDCMQTNWLQGGDE